MIDSSTAVRQADWGGADYPPPLSGVAGVIRVGRFRHRGTIATTMLKAVAHSVGLAIVRPTTRSTSPDRASKRALQRPSNPSPPPPPRRAPRTPTSVAGQAP